MVPDRLVLYDGDIYNYTTQAFAEVHARSDNHMRFFKTAGTSLSVELHATGASGDLGFVAEVVTLPISNLGISECLFSVLSLCVDQVFLPCILVSIHVCLNLALFLIFMPLRFFLSLCRLHRLIKH